MAANEYETVNRYKLARRFADTMKGWGLSELNAAPTDEQRETAGFMLGKGEPVSVATWELARYLLEEGR